MDSMPKMNSPELPKPLSNGGGVESGSVDSGSASASPEVQGLSPIEMLTQAQGAVVQAVQSDDATATPSALPVIPVNDPHLSSTSSNPVVADDNDALEKEWVDRAKDIVNKTKDDPRKQTDEFVKMRYDYVRKRFGKEIVVSNGNQAA
jgi:hypothetical protein